MIILVTGATGFIGEAVVRRLLADGITVRAFARPDRRWPFEEHARLERAFGDMRDAASLLRAARGVDGIVHLAAVKNDDPASAAVNVDGARHLAATAPGFLINVSTQSVRLPRKGLYASTKEEADRILEATGIPTTTLRPSLVYADRTSGVLGAITRFSRLPVIPVFGDGLAPFRPIHRDDVAEAIAIAIRRPGLRGKTYEVGGPDELSLNAIVDALSGGTGKLHLPVWLGLAAAHLCAILPRPPVTVSNVLGGAQGVPMDLAPFVRDFGFTPRGFRACLEAPVLERTAPGEAEALLRYVMGITRWEPGPQEIARYEAALRANGIPAHEIDPVFRTRPRWLGALDLASRLTRPGGVLQRKLLTAASLMECHPASADRLLPRDRGLCSIAGAVAWIGLRAFVKGLWSLPLFLMPRVLERNAG